MKKLYDEIINILLDRNAGFFAKLFWWISIFFSIILLFCFVCPDIAFKIFCDLISYIINESDENDLQIRYREVKFFFAMSSFICIYIRLLRDPIQNMMLELKEQDQQLTQMVKEHETREITTIDDHEKKVHQDIMKKMEEIRSHVDSKTVQFDSISDKRCNSIIKDLILQFGVINTSYDETEIYIVNEAVRDLLSLVCRYMHSWPVPIDEGLVSDYYIYTLAASHQESDLRVMKKYLGKIVKNIITTNRWGYDSENKKYKLPVLFAIQNRNVLLAEAISNELKLIDNVFKDITEATIPILVYQPEDRKRQSYEQQNENKYELFYRMFLGCDALMKKVDLIYSQFRCNEFELHGILIDCNITRGTSMKKLLTDSRMAGGFECFVSDETFIQDFSNQSRCQSTLRFAPIKDCATLFIASDNALLDQSFLEHGEALQLQFKNVGLNNLWYYFILPEDIKKDLKLIWTDIHEKQRRNIKGSDFDKTLKYSSDKLKAITQIPNGWIKWDTKSFDDFIQRLEIDKIENQCLNNDVSLLRDIT